MSEMKERVTKALREELRKIGYGVGTINADQLADALAGPAIEAMREPTEAMWKACERERADFETGIGWAVMIDEALK